MINEIVNLIGKPWRAGAEGPEAFDCWGLTRHVQRHLFGRELPSIKEPPTSTLGLVRFIRNHEARQQWQVTDEPVHGGLIEMSHQDLPHHIGVFLDLGGTERGVLHSLEGAGVAFDQFVTLEPMGWRSMTFYEWSPRAD